MNKTTSIAFISLLVAVLAAIAYNTLRNSETPEDMLIYAQQFCDNETTAVVELSQSTGYVKVTSTLLGGGSTYHSPSKTEEVRCPVVGPDAMTDECTALMEVSDWDVICSTTSTMPSAEEAELIAFGFMLNFIDIAPPEPSAESVNEMMDVLSSRALSRVNEATASSDFARFIGVQDVPDQGVSLEDVQLIADDSATVTVGLNYSGGRTLRDVHLIVQDGTWKVDSISVKKETAGTFENSGVLTKDAPGMESGVWFLLYEEPGKPALTQALRFNASSICANGTENSTCEPDTLVTGTSAKVLGEIQEDGVVMVTRLEVRG